VFEDFGLTHYENKALEIILSTETDLRELSTAAKIPPGKVYSIVKSLHAKGLIKLTETRPKKAYVENASEVISNLIEQKQQRDEKKFSQLRLLASSISVSKSEPNELFMIGSSQQENGTIQLKAFQGAKKEVCQIFNKNHRPKDNRENKQIWEIEIKKCIDKGVIFKALYPFDTVLPEILASLPKDKFIVRRYAGDFSRIDIIDNKKVLIKIVPEDQMLFGGLVYFENEKFSRNLKKIFDNMWDSASEK